MKDRITDRVSRRSILKTLAASGTVGIAGCGGGGGSSEESTPAPTDIPPKNAGIKEWGQRLNAHAREAGIDWEQFADDDITLTFGMGLHPYSTTFSTTTEDGTAVKDYFEELTGITVNYEIVSEDQFWLKTEERLSSPNNPYDGIMNGLWPAGGYHYGTDGESWVRDLNQYINDPSLTDKSWLAMDDFLDQTIELMSFPNEDGTVDFIGFPNGIETYGCTALHQPTLEAVGASEPTNYTELNDVARQISESDAVEREGIVSRTSSTTLSAANWGTMFKTFDAEWIDRESKTATLNSPEGVASLELFGGMLHNYGPENPSTYDWYSNNTRAGYARFNYVKDQVEQGNVPPVPGEGYLNAFEKGMSYVPGGDPSKPEEYPPVPVDTPQNMNIMGEAAQAMSNVISNGPDTAQAELDRVAPAITDYAKQIPDYYVASDRFL